MKYFVLLFSLTMITSAAFADHTGDESHTEPEQYPVSEEGYVDWKSSYEKGKKVMIPLPPLQQIKTGISLQDIKCKETYELIFKSTDGSPACVKPETKIKLIDRGWSKR